MGDKNSQVKEGTVAERTREGRCRGQRYKHECDNGVVYAEGGGTVDGKGINMVFWVLSRIK